MRKLRWGDPPREPVPDEETDAILCAVTWLAILLIVGGVWFLFLWGVV